MIVYKTEGRTLIKTCVRLNKFNQLELFYYDENNDLTCFTYAEGHNTACLDYMYSCKLVDSGKADAFIFAYNSYGQSCNESDILFVPSKRLFKGLVK